MLPLPLPLLQLLILLLLLPPLLLHLRLQLAPAPVLVVDEHLARLVAPLLREIVGLDLRGVDGPFIVAEEEHTCVGDGFIEALAMLLVHKLCLGFLEAVEGVGCERVLCFIGMNEERFLAVGDLDVGFGDAWLQVEDGVAVEMGQCEVTIGSWESQVLRIKPEGLQDSVDLGILS